MSDVTVTADEIKSAILDLPFANTAPIEWDDADWHQVRRALAALAPSALSGDAGEGRVVYSKYHIEFEYLGKNGKPNEWEGGMGASDDLDHARACMRLHNSRKLPNFRTGKTRIVHKVVTDTVVEEGLARELVPSHQGAGE